MPNLKILLATEDYWPYFDGGALFERRLAHGISGLGNDVVVITPGAKFKNFVEQDHPTKIIRLRSIPLIFNLRYRVSFWPFGQLKKLLNEFKPDVIHIHNPYLIGLGAIKYGKKRGIPLVATNHFMPENAFLNIPLGKLFYRPLTKLGWKYLVWFHNKVDFVTSPTPTAVDLLVKHGLKSPSRAISNGIDTEKFRPGQNATALKKKYKLPDKPIILYLGRVDGEKRLDILINGFKKMLEKSDAHLLIVGGGVKLDELKKLTQELGIAENVTFAGFIPEEEKPLIYNLANIFAITSPAELQSIVTLEAMATSLPVVSVDVAALKELVHNGENGYLVKFDDTDALAERLGQLVSNPEIAIRFGKESRRLVEDLHSTGRTFNLYNQVYLDVYSKSHK